MVTRRFWSIVTGSVLSVVVLAACGQSAAPIGATSFEGELPIGVNLELTGPGATVGVTDMQALEIAADQINAFGVRFGGKNKKVKLVVRDNATDPAKAAALTRDLVNTEHVAA